MMKSSLLSRSVVLSAVAGLCAATLPFTSASAEAPAAPTRAEVLAAATIARLAEGPGEPERNLIRALLAKVCATSTDDSQVIAAGYRSGPLPAGGVVDGLVLTTNVAVYDSPSRETLIDIRPCAVTVLTTTDPAFRLSGTVAVTVPGAAPSATTTATLTDLVTSHSMRGTTTIVNSQIAMMSAAGEVTRTGAVPTSTKVTIHKTAAQKRAAKRTYDAKVKAAKKTYKKAIKKAGKSKSKKAAAKRKYASKKAAYKIGYRKAIAPTSKTVTGTRQAIVERIPFDVSASATHTY